MEAIWIIRADASLRPPPTCSTSSVSSSLSSPSPPYPLPFLLLLLLLILFYCTSSSHIIELPLPYYPCTSGDGSRGNSGHTPNPVLLWTFLPPTKKLTLDTGKHIKFPL